MSDQRPVIILVVGGASARQVLVLDAIADACEERELIVDCQLDPPASIQGPATTDSTVSGLACLTLWLRAQEDIPAIRYQSSKRKGKGRNKGGNKWWE